jgi:hypothetical protein
MASYLGGAHNTLIYPLATTGIVFIFVVFILMQQQDPFVVKEPYPGFYPDLPRKSQVAMRCDATPILNQPSDFTGLCAAMNKYETT